MSINILIVDDHPLFRRGLADFIGKLPQLNLVAEASSGNEALTYLQTKQIDFALLDLDLPDYDGFELLAIIQHKKIRIKTVVLTMYDDVAYAQQAFELGANGYLVKDDAEELIIQCINEITQNNKFCSLREIDQFFENNESKLSVTENCILKFVGSGKSSLEISEILSISVRTVDKHRENIAAKLELKGPNALLKYVIQNRTLT